jgi:hypothetical protein
MQNEYVYVVLSKPYFKRFPDVYVYSDGDQAERLATLKRSYGEDVSVSRQPVRAECTASR